MNHQRKSIELLILLISIFCSCSGNQSENANRKQAPFSVSFEQNKSIYKQGDTIGFRLAGCGDSEIIAILDNVDTLTITSADKFSFPTGSASLGYHSMQFNCGNRKISLNITLLSSQPPQKLAYSVVATFPHAINSYTQGLLYDNGVLLESTGVRGSSKLMRVEINSGEPEQQIALDSKYFGEGLAKVGTKLYQLTWQAQIGFIYDDKTFEKIAEFSYPTEGWGLCFDGKDLIMSDGSQFLYFIDTASMEIIKQIAVFDHLGPVTKLNELEYVDGVIYANVYMTNTIVRVDPATGAVSGKLDCYGLLERRYRHDNIDVLNGIAHNDQNGHFYITGKNWPVLFEMEIIEKTDQN